MLFLGIIPALILLYITLKDYEGMYKDKTMFLMFIIGIITGVLAIILEYITIVVGVIALLLFPILEQMFKTIVLNMPRFHKKPETAIYGLSIGLGFGSVFTPYYVIISSLNDGNIDMLILALIASIGIILLHGATGVLIGYGVYSSKLTKYFIFSVLLYVPIPLTSAVQYSSIGIIPYGLIVYWYVTTKIMPDIKSKKRRKK